MPCRQQLTVIAFVLCSLLLSTGASHADRVVVVPLGAAKQLGNVVTVAKQHGDFTDPAAAMASITDASEDNPYLLLIGPGVYTLSRQLVAKPYVRIQGSGVGTTILKGAVAGATPADGGLIKATYPSNTGGAIEISDLTLINNGKGAVAGGIYGGFSLIEKLIIQHIDIIISSTNLGYGISGKSNGQSSKISISNCNIDIRGLSGHGVYIDDNDTITTINDTSINVITTNLSSGILCANIEANNISISAATSQGISYGIHLTETAFTSKIHNTTINTAFGISTTGIFINDSRNDILLDGIQTKALNSTTQNISIVIYDSSDYITITNCTVIAIGDNSTINVYAIQNKDSSPMMINVIARAKIGQNVRAIYDEESSNPIIINLHAEATSGSLNNDGILNSSTSNPTIRNSYIYGDNVGVNGINPSTRIRDTTIETLTNTTQVTNDSDPNTNQCHNTLDSNYSPINC